MSDLIERIKHRINNINYVPVCSDCMSKREIIKIIDEEVSNNSDGDGWILAEDRLPQKNATYYLVTTKRSPRVEMAWYLNGDWFWNNSDSQMGNVIAWMSLPELYKR